MIDPARMFTDVEALEAYFGDPNHASDIYWRTSHYPHGIDLEPFTGTDNLFRIVDPFEGRRPFLIDDFAIRGGARELRVTSLLVLDSSVATYLTRYYQRRKQPGNIDAETEKFVRWLSGTRLNVEPGYNLIERAARSRDRQKYFDNSRDTLIASMALQNMDRNHFLQTGEIALGIEGTEALIHDFGTADLEQIALQLLSRPSSATDDILDATYCVLLKGALIQAKAAKGAKFADKVGDLIRFVEARLDHVPSFEVLAAVFHLTGSLGKFLSLDKNMSFDSATEKVRHAAWDCLLMRTPQILLGKSTPDAVMLSFIVTADVAAAKIARISRFMFLLQRVGAPPIPGWEFTLAAIEDAVGDEEQTDRVRQELEALTYRRQESGFSYKTEEHVPQIMDELHQELTAYLGKAQK